MIGGDPDFLQQVVGTLGTVAIGMQVACRPDQGPGEVGMDAPVASFIGLGRRIA